jgi:toxin ParE1/3/4
MKLIIHPEALEEYESAADWYATRDDGLDLRFIDCVERTLRLVHQDPLRWRAVEDDVRRCLTPVFPFALLYTVESGEIFILAVMHTSREPGYWRSRRNS